MQEKFVKMGKYFYHRYPFLQPFLGFIDRKFFLKAKFSGSGMMTEHELPWNDEYQGEIFLKASNDIKNFEFTSTKELSMDLGRAKRKNLDELLWRHWIISYAVQHAIEFADCNEYNFVECGVADGSSAFIALRHIVNHKKINHKFSMHLYDSWKAMKKELLLKNELEKVDNYTDLKINTTKKNLSEFQDYVIYHQGYIPDSFSKPPQSPNQIVYLAIDLNSAKPTIDALDFFFSKLVKGGIIIFDDYGWAGWEDTKKAIDAYLFDKPGILMKLPTGQAIYYR